MNRLVLGTAGHIDHGKTSLVKALTGVDTDRLQEEQQRGMSIELGFAPWKVSENVEVDLIDVPGHEKFVGTMTSGSSSIEAALLVISVEDGVMPQTREHLRVLQYLGVTSVIALLSKCDLADNEIIQWQREELNDFFSNQSFTPLDIIEVSSVTGLGLDKLSKRVLELINQKKPPSSNSHPLMAIDRSFNLPGKGRILTGTLRSGTLSQNDTVHTFTQDSPEASSGALKSLHRHGQEHVKVQGPARLGVTFKGKDTKPLKRGDWLSSAPMVYTQCVLVSLTDKMASVDAKTEIEFHCGTLFRNARVKHSRLTPDRFGILEFDRPCWLRGGLPFLLRQQSSFGKDTIGGGIVADAAQPKFKGVYRALNALNDAPNERSILNFITLGARVDSLTHDLISLRFQSSLQRLLEQALKKNDYRDLKTNDGMLAPASHLNDAQGAIVELIRSELKARPEAKGLPESVVYSKLSRWSRAELQHAIKLSIERERLTRDQGLLRIRDVKETLSKTESSLYQGIQAYLRESELTPATLPELAKELHLSLQDVRDVVQRLHHHEEVVRLAPDLYAAASVAKAMIPRVVEALADGNSLSAGELKPYLGAGISRKWAIPWLEYLDRAKVTVRRGNERTLHPSRHPR